MLIYAHHTHDGFQFQVLLSRRLSLSGRRRRRAEKNKK